METSLYETDDSRNYLSIDGLIAVSGVQKNYHLKLAVKEIVDNALDASGFCVLGMIGKCDFYVHDSGTGIPGTDEQIAYLFRSTEKPFQPNQTGTLAGVLWGEASDLYLGLFSATTLP